MPGSDLPEPLGFPKCGKCPYLRTGTPLICGRCAHQTLTPLVGPLCQVCSQTLNAWDKCSNSLCHDENRSIDRIEALAAYSSPLSRVIVSLKNGNKGWAPIFGRLVLGHMNLSYTESDFRPDLVVANPTFRSDGSLGHTELVLEAARLEDVSETWLFEETALRLTDGLPPHGKDYPEKKAAADRLFEHLTLADGYTVEGLDVLVYDDVCTTGLQLDRVARFLKATGAARVEGLVMARTPWSS